MYGYVVARLQAPYSVPKPGPVHEKDIHRPVTKIEQNGAVRPETELSWTEYRDALPNTEVLTFHNAKNTRRHFFDNYYNSRTVR